MLKKLKNLTTKINIVYAIYSLAFSIMLMLSNHVFDNGSNVETIYITDFHLIDILWIVLFVPLVYMCIHVLVFLASKVTGSFFAGKDYSIKKLWVMFGCITLGYMLLWIPYLMSFWPGGIYNDTVTSLDMAMGREPISNHNPVLYTLLWKFVYWITGGLKTGNEYPGLKLFTVLQMLSIAVSMAALICWLLKKKVNVVIVSIVGVFIAVFPLYAYYGVSLWKDTPFSMVVFAYVLSLVSLVEKKDINIKRIVVYALFSILVVFLRNNGIYVVAFSALCIFIYFFNVDKKKGSIFGLLSLIIVILSAVIQGPVYDAIGADVDSKSESLGIPMQQVAYIYCTDGYVDEKDQAVLNNIIPLEELKNVYDPVCVDTIKFNGNYNRAYLEANSGEFLKTYVHTIAKNPVKAVKGYLLATMGFWDIRIKNGVAYVCGRNFAVAQYFQGDFFGYYFGYSFEELVNPRSFISSATIIWMLLFTMAVCISNRKYNYLVALTPLLGIWITLMIATPVAYSFRYVYGIFLSIPLFIYIIMRSEQKEVDTNGKN